VRSSLELLEEFADQGGQRAVFTGSCAEYDWQDGLCSEATTVLRPTTTYGLCKHVLGELFNHRVGREGSALSGAWARLFYLFGPREAPRRLLPSVVNSLLRGEQAHCSHAQQRRDYLFVADAADALVTLLESRVQGPINIASGEAPRVSEIIQRTAGKLAGQDLVRLGSLPTPDNDPPLIVADVERQSSELGWRPRWNLDNALDQTIAWWRDQQQTSSLE
jgi:nucleoside-diphosphate-sugar epimerase